MKSTILFVGWLLLKLPRYGQSFLGKMLGRLVHAVWKRRREIALSNVRRALPKEDVEIIVRRSFEHFGMLALELLMLPAIVKKRPYWLKSDDLKPFEDALQKHGGATLLTAHMGNWELLPLWADDGLPLSGMYQIQHQPTVDSVLYMLRSSPGLELVSSRYGVKAAFRILKGGRVLGSVGDQGSGVRVPFFGVQTSFPLGPVRMALKTGTPLLFCLGVREGSHVGLRILGEVPVEEDEEPKKILYNATAAFASMLEEAVRKNPEQYFWMHRIWKNDIDPASEL